MNKNVIDSAESFLNTAGPTVVILLLAFASGMYILYGMFKYLKGRDKSFSEERKSALAIWVKEQDRWRESIASVMNESKAVNKEVVVALTKMNGTIKNHEMAINNLGNSVHSSINELHTKIDFINK